MRHLSPGVREKTAACFSALGPQQTSTGWAPGEDSSELSQLGGQTSQIKVWAGPCALLRPQWKTPPASCSFWGPQAFLGLWLHHSRLCLCL